MVKASNRMPSNMSNVTTTSVELVQVLSGRHSLLPPLTNGDFRVPPAPPLVTSSTCSPPGGGSVVMRPPPPPPPKTHRPEVKQERIHHEEPSSSIPDLGKWPILHSFCFFFLVSIIYWCLLVFICHWKYHYEYRRFDLYAVYQIFPDPNRKPYISRGAYATADFNCASLRVHCLMLFLFQNVKINTIFWGFVKICEIERSRVRVDVHLQEVWWTLVMRSV